MLRFSVWPFEGKNFYRGIVERHLGFGKDAAYTLLRNPRHNWRRLMLGLAVKIATVFSLLTNKEAQLRDYDGLIGHATIVMIRYMFLSFRQRLYSDQRTVGSLFHACCEEWRT